MYGVWSLSHLEIASESKPSEIRADFLVLPLYIGLEGLAHLYSLKIAQVSKRAEQAAVGSAGFSIMVLLMMSQPRFLNTQIACLHII